MAARKTWIYYALSVLAILFYGWGLWEQKNLAALPSSFRMSDVSFPARIDRGLNFSTEHELGTASSAAELQFLIQALPAGQHIVLVPVNRDGGGVSVDLVPALTLRHFLITFISACLFWAVSVLFFAPRVTDAPARDFFFSTLLYGLVVAIGGVVPSDISPRLILSFLQIASLALLPVLFVHLSLSFPRRHPVLERQRWMIRSLFAVAAIVIVVQTVAYRRYIDSPGAGAWSAIQASLRFGDILMVLEVGAAVLLLLHNSRRSELERERKQARWLLTGFVVGVTPYVFLRTLPGLFNIASPMPQEFDRVFELAIPAAFVLAVARHRLLDIDVIIRRGIIYAALAATIVGLYLLFGLSVGRLLTRRFPEAERTVDILVVILAVAAYRPLRRGIGRRVDRTFFKIRYTYGRALKAMRRRLDACSSQGDVAESIVEFLNRTLEPKTTAVLIRSGGDVVTAGTWNGLDPREGLETANRVAASTRPVAAPERTSLPEVERSDFPQEFFKNGYRVIQPITAGGRVFGAILLGEKTSERRYVELDLKLLRNLGARAGKMIERLDLIQAAAAEALERNRLDSLNRMKTDFLSRVSHDLRTPLASIRWSSENLKDGVAGPLSSPQAEYVEAIRASSRQLGRLVENLLDLSRLELGAAPAALAPVSGSALVAESVTALGPLAAASKVAFQLRLEPDLPPLRGNPEKFMEIVTNLLENAVKFSPPETTVEIALGRLGADRQRLTVRDHGPGVPAVERETIWNRFAQGKAAGQGPARGYGLGLYVVKSYVELFGGTAGVADHPEGGAIFTCDFVNWTGEGNSPE